LEQASMSEKFVYTTYINTSPQRLWQALTEPAFTSRYWQATFDTGCSVGSQRTWHNRGVTIAHPERVILESDPYRRLAYTWHTFAPELAGEPRSKVTFDVEETGDGVKLTVVHDLLQPGGAGCKPSAAPPGEPRNHGQA
jgi:uncharacterized protein YndB with AHSA1/START domain